MAHRLAVRQVIRSVAGAVVVGVAVLAAAPAQAAFPGANGKIAFVQPSGIYTVNPDGSGLTQVAVSTPTGTDSEPQWSPDGQKIAFTDCAGGNGCDVWVVNADGSGLRDLSSPGFPATDRSPAWSPDGTRILFASPGPGGESSTWDAYIVDADGTGTDARKLTDVGALEGQWSSDGETIIFSLAESLFPQPGGGIWRMNADGSGAVRLVGGDPDVVSVGPSLAPDVSKIAFTQTTGLDEFGNPCCPKVFVMNPDGTNVAQITTGGASSPAWSPDGAKLALDGLQVMNPDGSERHSLGVGGTNPDWQPLPQSSPSPTYEAPKLAAPIHASLIPVFRQCGTGANPTDGQHSPPLGTAACLPPLAQGVAHFGPQAKGTAWVAVIYGDTNASNGDQADATLRFDLSDIRAAGGADYNPNPSGPDGTLVTRLRFTDRSNGPSGTSAGTATDLDFPVPFNCTPTSDPSLGSACALDTSADAVNPGAIKENKATVLQAFRLRLNDSGPNGVRGDSDDRLFATEGIYIP